MRAALPAVLLLVALAGCGTPGADLMVVSRSGAIPGADLEMRVVDDGQVICNGKTHDITSDDLIDAREVVRDLAKPASEGANLAPGHPTILRFRITTQDGTVEFSDTSKRQPQVFYKAAQLVRTLAKGACGLPR